MPRVPKRVRKIAPLLLATLLAGAAGAAGCAGARYSQPEEPAWHHAPPPQRGPGEAPPPPSPAADAGGSWGIDLDLETETESRDRTALSTVSPPASPARTAERREAAPREDTRRAEPDARGLDRPLVVYLGYLKLRVKRLLEAVDAITRLTEEAGGYVESLGARAVIVRIPATDFEKAMDTFAALGDVLDRRVKALDVTAQFTDLRARLAVAKEARERLLRLLDEVKDVQERLRILQEVKRLTEQIESIESTLSTLQNLVDYFTITIELEPVLATGAPIEHRSPFRWVRALTAHRTTIETEDAKDVVAFGLPTGFVLFTEDDGWRAQAADTTTLRIGRVPNEPHGDAEFWADAVLHELDGRDEELVEDGTSGQVTWRVFRNADVQPRSYLVGVHVRGDDVWVIEAFYPNEAAFERHHAALREALATFRVK